MTSLDTIYKNNLYRSHEPTEFNINQSATYENLRYSVISSGPLNSIQKQHRQNNLSYKYQRVGNMFKLVQVQNNRQKQSIQSNQSKSDFSDPKQQPIKDVNKINRINQAIHNLTSRVLSLELQQAKSTGLDKRLTQMASSIRIVQIQGNYLSDKVTGMHHEIVDLRQRLQEVEEQGGSYEKFFTDIFKLIKQIKQQTIKVVPQIDEKYNEMLKKLKQELKDNLQNLIRTTYKTQQKHSHIDQQVNNSSAHSQLFKRFSFQQKQSKILKYRQTFQTEKNQVYSLNQIIYKVDLYGRLLDNSGYLILDKNNRQIKLSQEHIKKLSQFGILKHQNK